MSLSLNSGIAGQSPGVGLLNTGQVVWATPGPAFNAAGVSGLLADFDPNALGLSNGALVSQFSDNSGNARHATQATGGKQATFISRLNAFSGYPAVLFSGGQAYATSAIDLSAFNALTIYVVAIANTTASDRVIIEGSSNSTSVTDGFLMYHMANHNWVNAQMKGNVGSSDRTMEFPLTRARVISAVYDKSLAGGNNTPEVSIAYANLQDVNVAAVANNTNTFGNQPWYIGGRGASSLYLDGKVGRMLVYSGAHSAADQKTVTDGLTAQYNLAGRDGQLIFNGDSSVAGTKATYPYPSQMYDSLYPTKDYDPANYGINGKMWSEIQATDAARIDPLWSSTAAKKILVVGCGSNDMGGGGVTPQVAYERAYLYCQSRKAATPNLFIVLNTILDRVDIANFWTNKADPYNQLIRANYALFADALYDQAADPSIGGALGYNTNPSWWDADQVHMNNTGQAQVAVLAKASVLGLGTTPYAYSGTIAADSGVGTTSTTVLGVTTTGALTWIQQVGAWGRLSNTIYTSAATADSVSVVETGRSDVTVAATCAVYPSSNFMGVCFNWTSNANYWLVVGNKTKVSLYKKVAGVFTETDFVNGSAQGDVLSASRSGNTITVKRNGTAIITRSDSFNATATKHGLYAAGANFQFTGFSVAVG